MLTQTATSTIATALLITSFLAGCSNNTATTGSPSVVVSAPGRDITIENEAHQKIVTAGEIYEDPELQEYINRIGQRLVAHSDQPNRAFTFSVLDTQMINAFAVSGGFVYISRGLLPFLDSEAELAGVIGHEIAHVAARHHGRRQTAGITSAVAATAAYILTGSGDLAEATSMYGAELISGYGRDMELEADGLGSRYMHSAGYDPQALLEVIGVLKNQEQYARVKAKTSGKPAGTYHGLYASHPRNDKRLQTVISAAAKLKPGEYIEDPAVPGEFRRQIEGLVWGPSVQGQREENRYYHNKLAFSFEHPPGWSVTSRSSAVVASSKDGSTVLTITLRRKDAAVPAKAVLERSASGVLSMRKDLAQAGLKGYSAVASSGNIAKRLAVIDYNYTYLFEGTAKDFATADVALLSMIESFRPIHPKERKATTPRNIHYVQVPRGATMASLASGIRIVDAEAQLRLLNGLYPRGEPRTGDWIKIIR